MSQYFSNDAVSSNRQKFSCKIRDRLFTFITDNGVFCKEYLDHGTRVLLENLPLEELSGKILDIGCGYGPIGVVVGKLLNTSVDMVDVNLRAIDLAKDNLILNSTQGRVFESDAYQNISDVYDVIITNPPIRAGKQKVYEIVFGAKTHLAKNGKLFIVIRKDQGAKSLISDLEKEYTVSIVKKAQGFFIIQCVLD